MIAYHLPGLSIGKGAACKVLGGEVRRLTFEEFKSVDRDWAWEHYFDEEAAVWVTDGSQADADRDEEIVLRPELIRLAASAVLEAPLPSPWLSIRYFGLGRGHVERRIGIFDRTFLLGRKGLASAKPQALNRIGELTDRWDGAGYGARHPAFTALDTYGAIYTALQMRPELHALPVMVALEGMFAGENAPKIARRMAGALSRLLPGDADIEEQVRKLYAVRSDIIHGRDLKGDPRTFGKVAGSLACRATLALMGLLMDRSVPPDRWIEVLDR